MGINLNTYKEAKDMCKKFVDNEDFSENVRMIASLNFTLVSVCEELNNINKSLEKIANKDFMQVGEISRTINKGEFYGPIKKELNLDTIICNQNKDGYLDKNIFLD